MKASSRRDSFARVSSATGTSDLFTRGTSLHHGLHGTYALALHLPVVQCMCLFFLYTRVGIPLSHWHVVCIVSIIRRTAPQHFQAQLIILSTPEHLVSPLVATAAACATPPLRQFVLEHPPTANGRSGSSASYRTPPQSACTGSAKK